MSSTEAMSKNTGSKGAYPRQLRMLRRKAGHRSAREFAEELGIPASTYSRYEKGPAGPGCGIPLPNAWAIADALGCSIDAVVGRENALRPRSQTLDERASRLSPASSATLEDFLGFLEAREGVDDAAERGEAR